MKFALCIYKYFPYSGLAKDFLSILESMHQRGHELDVYTYDWQGDKPAFYNESQSDQRNLNIFILKTKSWSNHNRDLAFYNSLKPYINAIDYDSVIAFNKFPNADIYYMGDFCYLERITKKYNDFHFLTKIIPRHLHFQKFERSVFDTQGTTHVLSISNNEKCVYQKHYQTQESRFHYLPPTISKDFLNEVTDFDRENKRKSLSVKPTERLIVFIGSGFNIKGLDRAIKGLALLKQRSISFKFLIIGQDNPKPYKKYVAENALIDHVEFLGGREDIKEIMLSADCLLHPSYRETGGKVLIEALACGLPILTTEGCGYAEHVKAAKGGVVLREPASPENISDELYKLLTLNEKEADSLKQSSREYTKDPKFSAMPEYAVDIIEKIASKKPAKKTKKINTIRLNSYNFIYCLNKQYVCDQLMDMLYSLDKYVENKSVKVLKNDRTTTVAVLDLKKEVVVKRYNTKSFWHIFKRSLRKTRAYNCWFFANYLLENNLLTPEPIAYRENRMFHLRGRSYYVSKYMQGMTVFEYLLEAEKNDLDKRLENTLVAMKKFFSEMQRHRITHGDMKASNFLMVNDQLVILDLDGMRKYISERWHLYKLFRDKRRFLYNWVEHEGIYQFFYDNLLDEDEKLKIERRPNLNKIKN